MSKIIVGVNTLTSVKRAVYSNHCQFWFNLGRHTDHQFILNHPERQSIDRMRNTTAKLAIDNEADYILFIDDDVLVPLDTVQRLLACDADIAAGWTIIRGYPFKNMFFRFVDEAKLNLTNVADEDVGIGVIDVDAVGFSCCLLKVDFLKKIDPPYFVTGPFNTEDIYYCVKARKKFPDCRIVVDTSVKTSHNLGEEYIDPLNKQFYKEYTEKLFPEILNPQVEPEKVIPQQKEELPFGYEDILEEAVFGDHK